ncbi:MAG: helix-turn-helix domain-containing protein [Treponema sp.]|jgi:excisionase family DNA binding protein|nr:helix-turn-helix domain-containing protein [Treponema sp.]
MQTLIDKTPMTINQAAEFTGYSKKYLYRLIHDGVIPYYKPDNRKKGKVIFCKEELASWIFKNRRQTGSELQEKAATLLSGGKK